MKTTKTFLRLITAYPQDTKKIEILTKNGLANMFDVSELTKKLGRKLTYKEADTLLFCNQIIITLEINEEIKNIRRYNLTRLEIQQLL